MFYKPTGRNSQSRAQLSSIKPFQHSSYAASFGKVYHKKIFLSTKFEFKYNTIYQKFLRILNFQFGYFKFHFLKTLINQKKIHCNKKCLNGSSPYPRAICQRFFEKNFCTCRTKKLHLCLSYKKHQTQMKSSKKIAQS